MMGFIVSKIYMGERIGEDPACPLCSGVASVGHLWWWKASFPETQREKRSSHWELAPGGNLCTQFTFCRYDTETWHLWCFRPNNKDTQSEFIWTPQTHSLCDIVKKLKQIKISEKFNLEFNFQMLSSVKNELRKKVEQNVKVLRCHILLFKLR